MNKKVIIIGAGGHAKVVADIVRKSGDTVVGFLDDDATKQGNDFFGAKILGSTTDYAKYTEECAFVIGIGNNSVRMRLSNEMVCRWYTAIHPSVHLAEGVQIGEGSVVAADAVINPDATIGRHSIVNTGAVVEHDAKIGDFTHLCPHSMVCGSTCVGNEVWLGAASTLIQCLTVCDNVTLGAGSVTVRNIEEAGTYVGVPSIRLH